MLEASTHNLLVIIKPVLNCYTGPVPSMNVLCSHSLICLTCSLLVADVSKLENTIIELTARLAALEDSYVSGAAAASIKKSETSAKPAAAACDDDDEDVDLFGSDEVFRSTRG